MFRIGEAGPKELVCLSNLKEWEAGLDWPEALPEVIWRKAYQQALAAKVLKRKTENGKLSLKP
jgi:hypothetical protein